MPKVGKAQPVSKTGATLTGASSLPPMIEAQVTIR